MGEKTQIKVKALLIPCDHCISRWSTNSQVERCTLLRFNVPIGRKTQAISVFQKEV